VVRLHQARRDLLAADPARGDRVMAVAGRWGFTSMSRFAADYRIAFGESPSLTLRRVAGR
jgi:AraC-like DNA-binding protein